MGNHAKAEEITGKAMVAFVHYLWSTVARRATRVLCILRCPRTCKPEVNQLDPSILIKDNVLSLNISMNDPIAVKKL